MASKKFDFPEPFGPINKFSGRMAIGGVSRPKDNTPHSVNSRINMELHQEQIGLFLPVF